MMVVRQTIPYMNALLGNSKIVGEQLSSSFRGCHATSSLKSVFFTHTPFERHVGQFFCQKVMLYTIFISSSSWVQPCNSWNDRKAEIRGQPVLRHLGPSPSACFGSNEGFKSSRIIWPFRKKIVLFVIQAGVQGFRIITQESQVSPTLQKFELPTVAIDCYDTLQTPVSVFFKLKENQW